MSIDDSDSNFEATTDAYVSSEEYEDGDDEPDTLHLNKKAKTSTPKTVGKSKRLEKKSDSTKAKKPVHEIFSFVGDLKENERENDQSDEKIITIPRVAKGLTGGRIYDRVHCCYFCGKLDTKIGRHLQTVHKDEDEIKGLHTSDKKEKDIKLDLLRFKGDFYRNMEIIKNGGELLVWRRPCATDIVTYKDYVPCVNCLAFVTKSEMWRHLKTCVGKSGVCSDDVEKCQMLLYPNKHAEGASKELKELILTKMKKDEIYQCASKDVLITTYGSFLMNSVAGFKKLNTISNRMRVLARLLLTMRKLTDQKELTLSEALKPESFDDVIKSTKELGGFKMVNNDGEIMPKFDTPSLPLLVGYAMEKCASLLNGIAIKARDNDTVASAKNFLKLYKLEWETKVSSTCLKNMNVNRFNKVQLLPITEDLMKVRDFMKEKIPELTSSLMADPSLETWRKLAEITGARLTIFNRRRGNEVFNMVQTRFNEREKYRANEMKEIKDSLTSLEKRLMDSLDVVHVRGKRGRQVPVLMEVDVLAAMEALGQHRNALGICLKNIYLFATPTRSSERPLRGNDCMNNVLKLIKGLQYAERIRSTELRKYCATVMQVADLSENDLRWVAEHLGHNLDVHREYYRLRESTVELSKVSRLLLAVDEGNSSNMLTWLEKDYLRSL